MLPIFKNCYDLDKRCYSEYGLSEDILMENAARGVSTFISQKYPKKSLLVVAGVGNNGADGIAVARQLHGKCKVKLFLPFEPKSSMAKLQLLRAQKVGVKIVNSIKKSDIILDAIFGAGLCKPLDDTYSTLIQQLNQCKAIKIACDIPTGIFENGAIDSVAFKADYTLTMGAHKEALYSDKASDFVGKIKCVDLGVSQKVYAQSSEHFLLQKKDFKPPLRMSNASHKGDFGHLNILAGQKQGAAILSAMSAMKFGTGLVTLVTNEAIDIPFYLMKDTHLSANCNAIAVGMGLGNEFLDSFLEKEVVQKQTPVLLDADALSNKVLLQILEQKERDIVFTPHPKEFCKLLSYFSQSIDIQTLQNNRFEYAKEFSLNFPHIVLVLKGANTIIAHSGKLFVNPFYSNTLSQAGSGDILSGLIAALLAQGYNPCEAAISGSLALSFIAKKHKGSNYSASADDLINALGHL